MDLSAFLPTLVEFSPTIADSDVAPIPNIVAVFSTEIDIEQVNTDLNLNKYIILVEEDTDTPFPVSFVSYDKKTLIFVPQTALNPGKTYLITILGSLASPEGRTAGVNRSWAFKIALGALSEVNLVSPGNLTAVNQLPPLNWTVATSAVSGAINYLVELDVTPDFSSVSSMGWSTTTLASSAGIGISLAPSKTYWWRVTPIQNSINGPHSVPWAFYLGTFASPSPDTQVLYSNATTLLVSGGFENGETNLSEWPDIRLTFGSLIDLATVNSSTVLLRQEPVDGFVQLKPRIVATTLIVSGATLIVTPDENILPNMRYTLVTRGLKNTLGNPLDIPERYFTGFYFPLYMGSVVLRANFGSLLDDVSDDFLNFHIFRVSLDANRHWIRAFNRGVYLSGPLEGQVRNTSFPLTYGMERWVEHESAARLLSEFLRQRLTSVGRSRKLGDYEESVEPALIQEIRSVIADQRKQALYWIAEFSRKRARMATARKSERYPRGLLGQDFSQNNTREEI
jgi:hypothetical protein